MTMIKSVLQALPIYTMSTFKIPTRICKEMDDIVRRFWWDSNSNDRNRGKFQALRAWEKIYKPNNEGGLGF